MSRNAVKMMTKRLKMNQTFSFFVALNFQFKQKQLVGIQ
jgi:hypothetical protein